jgi:hypothetical protein
MSLIQWHRGASIPGAAGEGHVHGIGGLDQAPASECPARGGGATAQGTSELLISRNRHEAPSPGTGKRWETLKVTEVSGGGCRLLWAAAILRSSVVNSHPLALIRGF